MPKTTQLDPYEALLRRAEHDPGLRARIAAARDRGVPASATIRKVVAETGDDTYARPDLPLTAPEDDINHPGYRRFRDDAPDASDAPAPMPIYPTPPAAPNAPEATDAGEAVPAKPFEWGYVPGKWKSGRGGKRYRRVAPWFDEVARTMADGTSLRVALTKAGIELTPREIHNLYRHVAFRDIYRRYRREHLAKWGRARIRKGAHIADFHKRDGC